MPTGIKGFFFFGESGSNAFVKFCPWELQNGVAYDNFIKQASYRFCYFILFILSFTFNYQ